MSDAQLDQLWTLHEVCSYTKFGKSTVYRKIQDDDFPKPIKWGGASRWLSSEVKSAANDKASQRK